MGYAGGHKYFTYASLVLSAISSAFALVPFYHIWRIIKEVLSVMPNFGNAAGIVKNGVLAVVFSMLSMLIYVAALMCSHKSAFRVQANLRKEMMHHIVKLPNGYNTEIGENGCNLSGGERQRISIARAFLKDAPVILLDEATASLDVENETLIQTALSRLIKDKTVIVIAHRMRTVENADKIVVLSNGQVAESGTPGELMEKDSIFKHMADLQTESQGWTIE